MLPALYFLYMCSHVLRRIDGTASFVTLFRAFVFGLFFVARFTFVLRLDDLRFILIFRLLFFGGIFFYIHVLVIQLRRIGCHPIAVPVAVNGI